MQTYIIVITLLSKYLAMSKHSLVKVCKSSLLSKDLKAVRLGAETIYSGSLFLTGQILFEKKLRYS